MVGRKYLDSELATLSLTVKLFLSPQNNSGFFKEKIDNQEKYKKKS